MWDFFSRLFDVSGFPKRWNCGDWSYGHGLLHILSDLGVWSAYVAIPCVLIYFASKKRDLPFRSIFWLFGAFILACGTTHLMEAIIFAWPAYRLAGVIKLGTALVSWATVIALVPITPKALALRTPEELEREVQERRKAEEELRRMHAELEHRVEERTAELRQVEQVLRQHDRNKDEFLAMLGHELRNPLAAVAGAFEVLNLSETHDPQMKAVLGIIGRQSLHMRRMIDDLLEISRIARGKIRLRPEPVNLVEVVRQAMSDQEQPLREAGLKATVSLPDEAQWVNGDRTRLAQVLGNLLQNATKFTDPGGTITVSLGTDQNNHAVLRVRDSGIGMTAESLSQIFQPFKQLDATRGGLGLGTALVKSLVELHGGSVSAASEGPGRGTEFTVRLPLAPVPAAGAPPAEEPSTPATCRVLVIDDRIDASYPVKVLLEKDGHQVRVASDGPTGIEAARTFNPQVIFCDIGMPGMDGYEVARMLRADNDLCLAYLVALTGFGQDEDRQRARAAGFDQHLTKPASQADLRGAIERMVRLGGG
jgi:signal transduction histidine kinase/ActR/RegA family two-component response regulator